MNTNAANSVSNSGATSGKPAPDEGRFLEAQSDQAQAAMKRALEDLKASLAKGVDVRLWAKEHPLGMAALATAAGFALAGAAVPSKRQQELKRWIAMERAAAAVKGNGTSHSETSPPQSSSPQPSFLATLGKEVITALRPALVGLITSTVAAHEAKQPPEPPAGSAG